MPAWSNWVSSQWIYTQFEGGSDSIPPVKFDQLNSTGHEILVKMGVNSLSLHLYACLIELGIIPVIYTQFEGGSNSIPPGQIRPVKFDRALNTGQIWWKFTEITLYACLVKLGLISVDLHPI